MAVKNAIYKVDNGTDFDDIMFKTTAEQVFLEGKSIDKILKKKVLYVDFRSNTGQKENYVILKHNLGYTPDFEAYAKCAHFYDAPNDLYKLPLHFSKDGNDFANIRIAADTTNFYIRLDRSPNYAANGWFNAIAVWVYYVEYKI